MSCTRFAVVYDDASKEIRRIIIPHHDSHLDDGRHHLEAGEAQKFFLLSDHPTPGDYATMQRLAQLIR